MAKLFTGDTHFNHRGLLKIKGFFGSDSGIRDFKNVQEMNGIMVYNWNLKVKPGDLVYHLGDFAFPNKGDGNEVGELLYKLNGMIYLIKGNHDDKNMKLFKGCEDKFVKIVDIAYIKGDDGQKMMLCHYPMISWRTSIHGSWHLHGHSHGSLKRKYGKALDVGVDAHDFFPLTYEEVKELMAKQPIWDAPEVEMPDLFEFK